MLSFLIRSIVWVSVLTGACSVLIVAAMTIGAQRPAPLRWLMESGCSLPCWRGIEPGKSNFLDAERVLHQQGDLEFQDSVGPRGFNEAIVFFQIVLNGTKVRGEMVSDENNSRVQYIYFYPIDDNGQNAIPFADFIAVAGAPSHMMQDTKNGSMVRFAYEGAGYEALNFPWLMYGPAGALGCGRLNSAVGVYLGIDPNFEPWDPWRGFGLQFDRWCNEVRP